MLLISPAGLQLCSVNIRGCKLCVSLVLLAAAAQVLAVESNHQAPVYDTLEACVEAVQITETKTNYTLLKPGQLNILSWNIEKGKNAGWKKDLREMAENIDFVLLQEAIFVDEMKDPRELQAYWSFSPGYATRDYSSGIMTVARMPPDLVCSFQVSEPWLRSPKLVSISRYSLASFPDPLLLVNLHAINFTLGTREFAEQMHKARAIVEKHSGPIVMAGDFNTWNADRKKVLETMAEDLDFDEVVFTEDNRVRAFDYVLDYVFVKGLKIETSRAVEVETSDHNPLVVTLSLETTEITQQK